MYWPNCKNEDCNYIHPTENVNFYQYINQFHSVQNSLNVHLVKHVSMSIHQ